MRVWKAKGLIVKNEDQTRTLALCGDDRFITKMENLLGRKLTALPKGRPRKTK